MKPPAPAGGPTHTSQFFTGLGSVVSPNLYLSLAYRGEGAGDGLGRVV